MTCAYFYVCECMHVCLCVCVHLCSGTYIIYILHIYVWTLMYICVDPSSEWPTILFMETCPMQAIQLGDFP